jgi:hypothetical protein
VFHLQDRDFEHEDGRNVLLKVNFMKENSNIGRWMLRIVAAKWLMNENVFGNSVGRLPERTLTR